MRTKEVTKEGLLSKMGEAFLLIFGVLLLTVKFLCLQSLKALIRLGGRFGYFLFFSARGGGRVSSSRRGGGGTVLY